MIAKFADRAAFDAWHDTKCADLGIPHPGYNQGTGELALDCQWTTAWVEPVKVDGQLCITLPDADIAADVILSKLAPVELHAESVIEAAGFDVAKPLPAKWTVDGIEYDVPIDAAPGVATPKEP